MLDLLIRGGLVVTSDHEAVRDVGVQGGRIAYVAERGGAEVEAATVIDATNMLVLPGGVEAHAHIAEPAHRGWTRGEEVWLQSPQAATRAAAFAEPRRSPRLPSWGSMHAPSSIPSEP